MESKAKPGAAVAHGFAILLGVFLLPVFPLAAEVVPSTNSASVGSVVTHAGFDFGITGGTKVGGNLFHSFSKFSLDAGESGTFSGPGGVNNILARVTDVASNINGTLRSTIPGANLYFINPKGVHFGPNASLDIDGSFTATTAEYVSLAGGGRFDATTPANDVLTAAPVSAFGFLAAQPAAISATSSVLTGATGKNVSFVGGNLTLNQATINAPSGRVALWSAGGRGEVAASDGTGALGGAINLLRSSVDASGAPGGSVVIRGGRLTVDRSSIVSENSGAGAGGGIDVRVSDAATITRSSRILTTTSGAGAAGDVSLQAASVNLSGPISVVGSQALKTATSTARSGKVNVNTDQLSISNEGSLSSSTFGLGAGNNVSVQAKSISIIGVPANSPADESPPTGIFSNTSMSGAGGGVRVQADTIQLLAGGAISADTYGLGKGGNVDVIARYISIAAREAQFKTGIFADSGAPTADKISPGGVGGSLHVTADRIQITDGGLISTKSVGRGAGGDTTIDVRELLIAKGNSSLITGIAVDAAAGPGRGGNLRINADVVRVLDGGRISANAGDTGPGGDVSIHAREIVIIGRPDQATGITAESTSLGAGGASGNIDLVTNHLTILNGGRISASTFGGGAGGDVLVRAQDALIYAASGESFTGIAAESVSTTAAGPGGSVRVEVPALTLSGFGTIAANTAGPGAGGSVTVVATTGKLLGGGRISADTAGLGVGGSVLVKVNNLLISGGAARRPSGVFSGSVADGEGGPGGRVEVVASTLRLTGGGSIAATSESTGAGGSVAVRANKLTLDNAATIAASATGPGVAGSVAITVRQPLELRSGSSIRTTSTVSDAGTVSITSATDIYLTDSTVTVSALVGNAGQVSLRATGRLSLINSSVVAEAGLNGGNVFIDPEFVLLDHSRISANAILGAGGNILIVAGSFLSSSSSVTASSEASVQGSVQIQSLIVDLSGALVLLPSGLVDVSTQLREQCARRLGLDFSSFLVLGRGATADSPDDAAIASPVLPPLPER